MTEFFGVLEAELADRYRIERELGAGAMATVYLAHDIRHDRKVALKVPHPDLSDRVGVERFLEEIRTTAQLQHPHILPLYDSGKAAGVLFYVMPYVEGESLRARLEREGKMPVDETSRLVCEVADALSYAHGQGIVHRDIKPENIMLADGHARVADFGIACAVTALRTEGFGSVTDITGTAAYMSPEQSAGDQLIDERSDIYSLGCVMFEMLAGGPPFVGQTDQAIMAQRFAQPTPSVREKRAKASHRIDAAIRTAMAIEPRERFQSVARFADAISRADVTARNGEGAKRSIAVLPFTNLSSDLEAEFFSDGISEDILNALVRLPGLRVIARTSSFAFKGKQMDVREIGKLLDVATVLEGSVRKSGNRLRITAQLVDAAGGHQIWSERYDREMEEVFAVQDEITGAIRDALSATLLGLGPARPQPKTTIDLETYEIFLRGRFFVAKRAEGMQKGMELLGEVVARAPEYAPAYAELATAYSIMTLYCAVSPRLGWSRVRELAHAALQLDPTLARAHAELGNVALWFDWKWPEAREHFERAVTLDPNDPWLDVLFSTYLASLGQHDEAVEHCERARSLDPLNPSLGAGLAMTQFLARRHRDAISTCDRIIEQDGTYSDAYRVKGASLRELKKFGQAMPPTEAAVLYSGTHPWMVSLRGMLHGAAGRTEEARAVAQELTEKYRTATEPPFVPPLAIALVYGQLGDADAYFEWMQQSFAARDGWLIMLRGDPSFDPYRNDPRHAALVDSVGIPAWGSGVGDASS